MNLLRDAPVWAQLLLTAILVGAAIHDCLQRRISNWLCLAVALAAVIAAIAAGPTSSLWQNGVIGALLLGIGLPLFAAGWLGGGDVKLLTALGLWTNFAVVLPLLACVLLAGGVVALLSIMVRGGRAARRSKGVPYGVAIAIGTAIMLLRPTMFEPPRPDPLDLRSARAAIAR